MFENEIIREFYKNNRYDLMKLKHTYDDKVAVIVESRFNEFLPWVINNIIYFTGWRVLVYCSQNNEFLLNDIDCDKKIIDNNFDVDDYNCLLTSKEFWCDLPKNVLVFQTDSFMLKNGIEEFLEYDYVGAPWSYSLVNPITMRNKSPYDNIGNGGFSIRNRDKMIEIIDSFPRTDLINEDIYFAMGFGRLKNKNLPTKEIQRKFGCESIFSENPLSVHNFCRYHDDKKINKIIPQKKQIKNIYYEKIVGFFHISCIGDYKSVIKEILEAAKKSDMKQLIEELKICVCGGSDEDVKFVKEMMGLYQISEKYEILIFDEDYEYPTLKLLQKHCKLNPNGRVLYFHTKGVSKTTTYRKYWRKAMVHHIISGWENCIYQLRNHDMVGYNWKGNHFSGNFWYATNKSICDVPDFDEIRKNPILIWDGHSEKERDRLQCEFFWEKKRRKNFKVFSVGSLNYDMVDIDEDISVDVIDKDPFDGIVDERYLINLDSRPDKMDNAIFELESNKIKNVKRFSAIPARAMRLKSVGVNGVEQTNSGVIGCTLSHYLIISKAYWEGFSNILVMEDDIKFKKGFQEYFKEQYSYVPKDYDILWIGGYERYGTPKSKVGGDESLVSIPNDMCGTECYLLSKSGIEKIYDFLSKNSTNIDIDIVFSKVIPNLKQYSFSTQLAKQCGLKSDILF